MPASFATEIVLPLGLEVKRDVTKDIAKFPTIPFTKLGIPSNPLNKLPKPPPAPPVPAPKKLPTLVPKVSKEKPAPKPPPAA